MPPVTSSRRAATSRPSTTARPAAETRRAPGWVARLDGAAVGLLLLALAGAAVSGYLTAVHYAQVAPVCANGGIVDCTAVTQSSYSTVPGTAIPVTVPGLAWCAASAALALLALRASLGGFTEPAWLRPVHAILALIGLLAVLYFVYAEAVPLQRLCEWCTAVHLAVFGSLLLALQRLRETPRRE